MKVLIERASIDYEEKPCDDAKKFVEIGKTGWQIIHWYIDVNSLEDLFNLMKTVNHSIILGECDPTEKELGFEYSITIYDDYIE